MTDDTERALAERYRAEATKERAAAFQNVCLGLMWLSVIAAIAFACYSLARIL